MKFFLCALFFILTTISLGSELDSLFAHYSKLNEIELRLVDFKDSPEVLRIKIEHLSYINASRKKRKLSELELDILACRVANKMAKEASDGKFWGHWNTRGEKPYHRYHLAGGIDHVNENAYAYWSTEKTTKTLEQASEFMRMGHDSFMSEKAPNDGHKKNILTPAHNFVGIGYAFSDNNFRYYEEFIDRYCQFELATSNTYEVKKELQLSVKSDTNIILTSAFLTKEKKLKKKGAFRLKLKGGYLDGTTKFVMTQIPDPIERGSQRTYQLSFQPKKAGTYYVHTIYKRVENGRKRGKEFQTSGMLIEVHKSAN